MNIKIKNDQTSEDLKTDVDGVAKAAKKYAAKTKFTVELSKEGYQLVTDVTKGIIVDARQSENQFSFKKNIKSVSLISIQFILHYYHYYIYDFLFSWN